MALLNTGCLISTIQADVTGVTTGYAAECFAIIAAGVDSATANRCVVFPNSGCLPSLYPTQTIPEGQIVFLDDICIPLYAGSGEWLAFDKRSYRRDRPIIYECYLYTFGSNLYGQLGDGSTTSRSSPGTVAGAGTTWCQITAGGSIQSSAGVKTDGTLWTWGANGYGVLGDGTTTSRSSPGTTAGGGTTWCMVKMGGSRYTTVGAATAAIKTDGTLWTWGYNGCGQLGDGTTTSRLSPGTVAGGGTNWCTVAVGYASMAAIKTDGTLWTWGYNHYGRLGDGTTTNRSSPGTVAGGGTNWCQVSLSSSLGIVAAIKTDGTLWTWGYDSSSGVLGSGFIYNTRSSPGTTAGGGTNWCKVEVGCEHVAALKTDGTLWTWGNNFYLALGTNDGTNRSSPVTVYGGGTTWCDVASGTGYSLAIKTDGTLWGWGANFCGQLGDGTTTTRSFPTSAVGGFTDWTSVVTNNRALQSNSAALRKYGY